MKNKWLYIESIGVMILTLLVILVLYALSFNVNIFNVLKKTYKKIDLYDLYYSQLKPFDTEISKDIILVNIGNESRGDIARMLTAIEAKNPKVIGLDVFFKTFDHTPEDSLLLESLQAVKDKLVLAYFIKTPGKNMAPGFNLSDADNGYSNFIGNKKGAPVRNIELTYNYEGRKQYAFAYSISRKYDPEITKYLDDR
ncbi:MAG: CHASE2 domain-containing protein, partial [Psychroserpens sp.]|nr:CHASE2 domain-containing protein [Psychroserpens sp.]